MEGYIGSYMMGICGLESSGRELVVAGKVMRLEAPYDAGRFLTNSATNGLSTRDT
jgi:hypothetical protein